MKKICSTAKDVIIILKNVKNDLSNKVTNYPRKHNNKLISVEYIQKVNKLNKMELSLSLSKKKTNNNQAK